MKTRLLNLWEIIRSSFWFIPGLMVFSAITLSFFTIAVDRKIQADLYPCLDILFKGGPEGARSVLTTIAGSMITVAGVAFSITIVALTMASQQFGPRLLTNFMKDKGNQFVLGTFIATFIYCLFVLRNVYSAGENVFVPTLSVTFSLILALVNVGVLIYFIHHVSTSIQADHIIAAVYNELLETIQRIFPVEIGYEKEKNIDHGINFNPEEDDYHKVDQINAVKSGYLQAIDGDGLLELAKKHDLRFELQCRPGEFIIINSPIVSVKYNQINENLIKKIVRTFILGSRRTPEQDAEYAIHQLTEVAIRALSPGINDPFTANSCIDRLGSALCIMTKKEFPSPYRYDEENKLRVIAKPLTFSGITNAAFDQIRQFGRTNVSVTIRILETLKIIAIHTRNDEQRKAILRQAKMAADASHESIPQENDRKDVQKRYQALLEVLDST